MPTDGRRELLELPPVSGRRYMLLAIADEAHKEDAALGAFLDSFDFVAK